MNGTGNAVVYCQHDCVKIKTYRPVMTTGRERRRERQSVERGVVREREGERGERERAGDRKGERGVKG